MKIYLKKIDIHNIDLRLINEYKCKTEKFTFILSLNGVIRIANSNIADNKLMKIDILDKPITEITINNISLLCDESEYVNF